MSCRDLQELPSARNKRARTSVQEHRKLLESPVGSLWPVPALLSGVDAPRPPDPPTSTSGARR
eukprot:1104157-Alexandrium_andersonii.AAC.1